MCYAKQGAPSWLSARYKSASDEAVQLFCLAPMGVLFLKTMKHQCLASSTSSVPDLLQDKVASSQSQDSPSKASPEQSSELAEMQQGLQKSNAALEAAQSHLSARQEEALELTQRLEAAQAEIASLQV